MGKTSFEGMKLFTAFASAVLFYFSGLCSESTAATFLTIHVSAWLAIGGLFFGLIALSTSKKLGNRIGGFCEVEDLPIGETFDVLNPAHAVITNRKDKKRPSFAVMLREPMSGRAFFSLSRKRIEFPDEKRRSAVALKKNGEIDIYTFFTDNGPGNSSDIEQ